MTQEQKYLLLKDLCSRTPYGVKIDNFGDTSTLISINNTYRIIVGSDGDKNSGFDLQKLDVLEIEDAKPYLFPLSSMTDEQRIDLTTYINTRIFVNDEISFQCLFDNTMDRWKMVFEWCDKNHFDYRGLIPIGLANDATGLNIY